MGDDVAKDDLLKLIDEIKAQTDGAQAAHRMAAQLAADAKLAASNVQHKSYAQHLAAQQQQTLAQQQLQNMPLPGPASQSIWGVANGGAANSPLAAALGQTTTAAPSVIQPARPQPHASGGSASVGVCRLNGGEELGVWLIVDEMASIAMTVDRAHALVDSILKTVAQIRDQ